MPRRGWIALVPFPFSDLSATKRRPVLCLTDADAHGDFIAIPITSRPQTDDAISIEAGDLIDERLPVQSWIRTNRIVTLNAGIVVKTYGRVTDDVLSRSVNAICDYIRGASGQ